AHAAAADRRRRHRVRARPHEGRGAGLMVFPGDYAGDGPNRASDEWQPEDLPPVPGDEWMQAEAREAAPAPAPEPAPEPVQPEPVAPRSRRAALAFAPLHKRAFGIAVGVAVALLVGGVTLFHLL